MNQIGRMSGFIRYVNDYRYLVEFRKNQWLKTPELERIQEKKLRAIISHAYHNVPFYHKLFDSVGVKPDDIKTVDDLSMIPIITKSQVRHAGNDIIAKGINLNKCEKDRTSGSTGEPLTIVFDKKYIELYRMVHGRTLLENGCRLFRDSIASITARCHSQDESKSLLQYIGLRKRYCISVYEDTSNQIRLLKKIKPDVLMGYPSSIKLLAMAVQEKDIKEIHPRLVFSAAELLDTDTRKLINSIFGVDMIDYYGSMEGSGMMAWECREHSGYHMNIDSVVMEFIKDGERVAAGERGEIVLTNLHSYAMPFIRYKIGDIGIPSDEECPCGRGLPLIEGIEGRMHDLIKLSGGRVLSPYKITSILVFIPGIAQFRLIQESEDEFLLHLVKGKEFCQETIEKVGGGLKNILGAGVHLEIQILDEIPIDPSGKIRSIISKVKS